MRLRLRGMVNNAVCAVRRILGMAHPDQGKISIARANAHPEAIIAMQYLLKTLGQDVTRALKHWRLRFPAFGFLFEATQFSYHRRSRAALLSRNLAASHFRDSGSADSKSRYLHLASRLDSLSPDGAKEVFHGFILWGDSNWPWGPAGSRLGQMPTPV